MQEEKDKYKIRSKLKRKPEKAFSASPGGFRPDKGMDRSR